MNKLKKYAGLLNDEAPKDHFLAYITEDEKDMLVKAGGKETATQSGILAYPPLGQPGTSPGTTTSGGSAYSGNGGQETNRERAIRAAATTGSSDTGGVGDPDPPHEYIGGEKVYIGDVEGKRIAQEKADVKPEDTSWFDPIKNYIESGGMIGMGIKLTGEVLSKLGEFSSELQKKAMTMSLNSRVKRKMKTLDLNNPNSMNNPEIADLHKDLADIEAGTFTQTDFTEKYGSGDLGGGEGDGEDRELMNTFVPYAAHAVGGTTPQESMVNKYFANLNNTNLGINQNYLNTYNTAKTNIANTLNMTQNTSQYGYGNTFNDNYARSMTSANPFFDELTSEGLI